MDLAYQIFDKLKVESTSVIDRHNFITKIGGTNIDWNAHSDALGNLANRKLIRLEGLSRQQIVLLPKFYDAVMEGGIDELESAKEAEKQLTNDLIKSSIRTNSISKKAIFISTFIAIVTLMVLLFDTFFH